MKAAAIALGAFAVLGAANAGSLRATKELPVRLLARCQGDVKPSKCCTTTAKQDPLYGNKAASFPNTNGQGYCCDINMGMWVPNNDGGKAGQFCTLDNRVESSRDRMNTVKGLTDKMLAGLETLQEEKESLKNMFKERYIAHEAQELEKKDSNDRIERLVDTKQKEAGVVRRRLDGLNIQLGRIVKTNEDLNQEWQGKIDQARTDYEETKTKIEKSSGKLVQAKKRLELAVENLNSCGKTTDQEKRKLAMLEAAVIGAGKNLQKVTDNLNKLNNEYVKKKKTLDDEIEQAFNGNRALIASRKKLKKTISTYETSINMVNANIKTLKAQLEETSFLEVCDDDCVKAMKSWNPKAYAASDDESGMTKAKQFVNDEMTSLHEVMKNVKAVRKRIHVLKDLDDKLNEKIMAELKQKSSKLVEDLKIAKRDLYEVVKQVNFVHVKIGLQNMRTEVIERMGRWQTRLLQRKQNKAVKDLVSVQGELQIVDGSIRDKKNLFKSCAKELGQTKDDIANTKSDLTEARANLDAQEEAYETRNRQTTEVLNDLDLQKQAQVDRSQTLNSELAQLQAEADMKPEELRKANDELLKVTADVAAQAPSIMPVCSDLLKKDRDFRDKAKKGSAEWCACANDGSAITNQNKCENEGGGRKNICAWNDDDMECMPSKPSKK